MKLIINADDCGLSQAVDEHIENAILSGKITSTTVMANMGDLEGAAVLYQKYKDKVSFGWHLNLTEGKPLTQSQILLDKGFFVESEQGLKLNGRKFKHKMLPKEMTEEIKKEMAAQYEALRDNGINPTHVDGHHHIQTSVWAMGFLSSFLKIRGIDKMRRMYNNETGLKSFVIRGGWALFYKINGMKMPDMLCNYLEFANNSLIKNTDVIELECHPGHPNYTDEENALLTDALNIIEGVELINYTQL